MQSSVSWVPHSLEQSKQTSTAVTNEQQTEGEEEKKPCCQLEDFFLACLIEGKKKSASYAPGVTLHKAFWQLQCLLFPPHITTDTPSLPVLLP